MLLITVQTYGDLLYNKITSSCKWSSLFPLLYNR